MMCRPQTERVWDLTRTRRLEIKSAIRGMLTRRESIHNLFEKPVPYFDYPTVPLDLPHKPSMRVSINPQFLHYDVVCDSGINVGYNNREQTVGPGESKKYLWYADKEYGACLIQSFGDLRNHRYHGLFGAIIIEPPGAKWYQNFSLKTASHEEEAVITAPGVENCTMMPADKPRNVGFTIHGHEWKQQPDDPYSRIIPLQGAVSIGNTFDMELMDGAHCPGDYLYRSGSLTWDVESGMWGIFRVMKQGIGYKCRKLLCRHKI